ncbi:flagellar hook-length control protein FliK [Microvirga puerhi]|uniref:Flagellar hook-length control protein FliK n=1 Tax=Microvirga puerhi TaxID=2876078 RepID=A0ABS7VSP6_9HYPH|nr:flagellar hook-length control protein FliK [Microvirga puerhi]MBZ6078575.1 flagellar hook-length control protein FliK [Microvirga puerhi]
MSKLEFILQNATRRVDSTSLKGDSGQSLGGERTDVQPTGSDFDALLKTIASQRDSSDEQRRQVAAPARLGDIELDSERSRASEAPDDPDTAPDDLLKELVSADTTVQQQDTSFSLSVNFISPSHLNPTLAKQQQASAGTANPLLEFIRRKDDTDASDIMQRASNAPHMKASVLHQEAHFKPVVPNSLPRDVPLLGPGETFAGPGGENLQPTASLANAREQALLNRSVSEAVSNKGVSASSDPTSLLTTDRAADSSLFQRIADAIVSGAGRDANEQVENAARSQASASIVLRPSEGVLRVLNIQLHPAELGVVTVKMRLSGENLEMELHTSNGETADILRTDMEKLSSLLRTSGYRPDVISVHLTAADGAQQDNSTGQKSQWAAQSNSNGFQQGSNGQEDRARHPAENRDDLGQRVQKNGAEEKPVGAAGIGSVYL